MRYIAVVFCTLLLISSASAGLIDFSLNPSLMQSGPGGDYQPLLCQNQDGSGACVIFSGTVTFTNDQDWSLQSIDVTMNPSNPDGGSQVFANDNGNYFLLFGPGVLGPDGPTGNSYTGGLFEVDVATSAAIGAYFGSATLNYSDGTNTFTSAPVGFELDVVPEPSTLLLGGISVIPFFLRRREP